MQSIPFLRRGHSVRGAYPIDIEFIGLWKLFNNPVFNSIEFDGIKNMAGSNSFALTPKRWIETTHAIGIVSKTGRYGGTFAHRDIAFEFAYYRSNSFPIGK